MNEIVTYKGWIDKNIVKMPGMGVRFLSYILLYRNDCLKLFIMNNV